MVNTIVPKSVCLVYWFEFSSEFINPALAVVICFPKPSVRGSSGFDELFYFDRRSVEETTANFAL